PLPVPVLLHAPSTARAATLTTATRRFGSFIVIPSSCFESGRDVVDGVLVVTVPPRRGAQGRESGDEQDHRGDREQGERERPLGEDGQAPAAHRGRAGEALLEQRTEDQAEEQGHGREA